MTDKFLMLYESFNQQEKQVNELEIQLKLLRQTGEDKKEKEKLLSDEIADMIKNNQIIEREYNQMRQKRIELEDHINSQQGSKNDLQVSLDSLQRDFDSKKKLLEENRASHAERIRELEYSFKGKVAVLENIELQSSGKFIQDRQIIN